VVRRACPTEGRVDVAARVKVTISSGELSITDQAFPNSHRTRSIAAVTARSSGPSPSVRIASRSVSFTVVGSACVDLVPSAPSEISGAPVNLD
jgi:hypothetical protein